MTTSRGAAFCTGCKASWQSVASSMCCARASATNPMRSNSFTARRRRAIRRRQRASSKTSSASRASCATAGRSRTPAGARPVHLFINGLPVATFELKNSLTKQTATATPIEQYKRDRDPRRRLLCSAFGRCARPLSPIDDHDRCGCARTCRARTAWRRTRGSCPSTKGFNDGAGNPPNALRAWHDRLPLAKRVLAARAA
jgi:hypothetical protein